MNMQKITILCCLFLSSCCLFEKKIVEEPITDMPVTPKLVQYKEGPILKKMDNDYLVTKELVNNATLLTDYYKRLEKWKEEKKIR
jgi:hypothetical protein